MKTAPLIKILRRAEWESFQASGKFDGSPDDLRDGFIHLSTGEQVAGTLARHFAAEPDVMLVEIDVGADAQLRFEPSRNGELFPHLYRALTLADVVSARPV